METQSLNAFPRWHYAALYAALLAMLAYVFVHAWVSEDAYITFRVIDNFFHGYGLRWNIDERVQVYTHPLWLLVQLPLHAIWGNLFQSVIMLSLVCSMAAIVIPLCTIQRPLPETLLYFFLPLALSRSFMDYTTSGLENPLCYLLYAAFGYVLLELRDHLRFWFYISLTVALALLNRLDTALLYVPVLVWLGYTQRRSIRWPQVWLGVSPLLAWFGFSLFYYGFLFPNTKYAKLDTGLGTLHYLEQGWHYTVFMLAADTVSAVILVLPLVFLLLPLPFTGEGRGEGGYDGTKEMPSPLPPLPQRSGRGGEPFICLMLGICWYVCYVIAIGGDYMMGRFWALPVFASAWLTYIYLPRLRRDVLFALAALLLVAYEAPAIIGEIHKNCQSCTPDKKLLVNARNLFWKNQLVARFYPLRIRQEGKYEFSDDGKKLSQENPPPVKKMYFIGMIGYYAGPKVTLIDELALADPLLARLPAARQQFFIGHFRRDIPKGYIDAVRTGDTGEMNPALAKYYEKLRLITSGDLMDLNRLKTIIAFNLGSYDDWKQEYLERK